MRPSCLGRPRGPASATPAQMMSEASIASRVETLRIMEVVSLKNRISRSEDVVALLQQLLGLFLHLDAHFLLDLDVEVDDDRLVGRLHLHGRLARCRE